MDEGLVMKGLRYILIAIAAVMLFIGFQQKLSTPGKLQTKTTVEGFVELEPSEWEKYAKPVREYMYYRTQAVINDDINILWDKYPKLKGNIQLSDGVNVEKYILDTLNKELRFIDASYDIEYYNPLQVKKVNENEVNVLVHGMIVYLTENFEEIGGERLIEIYLQRAGTKWEVVKTDEYTEEEYKALIR